MRHPLRLAGVAAAIALASGCGSSADIGAEPVFALDRDIAGQIANVPADRERLMSAFELRLALQALLTDHATLSNEAMRRAIDGGDLEATLRALTDNTDQLTLAMGLIYGPEGANAFDQLWTNHIEFFNDYATAIRVDDAAAIATVRVSLDHYESDFADFVTVATRGELGFETVLDVLHSHVGQLLGQADAWEAGDYAGSFETASEAYHHMDVIASALAGAIAAQMPEVLPGSIDGPESLICAAARLAVGEVVVAAADAEWAQQLGPASHSNAAELALEASVDRAEAWVDDASMTVLLDAVSAFDASESVTVVRDDLLDAVVDEATTSACAAAG